MLFIKRKTIMNHTILINYDSEHRTYPIFIGQSLFDCSNWLPKKKFSQIIIISDNHIKKIYGQHLQNHLKSKGHVALLLSFPAGEKSKTYKTKQVLEEAMCKNHCDKDIVILALGGGVVGDLAGFVAATFLRGVTYIQVPTSLLAMVDSSIGGKTGINTRYGKNTIGSIYQPYCVVTDVSLLKTLPKKQLINGLIECIKMFLTHDAESFHYVESHLGSILQGDTIALNELITRVIRIKSAVVTRDEKDCGERKTLNFGHTIGHALEKLSHFSLLHGYAVAYGMLVEATISCLLGLLDNQQLTIIKKMMVSLNIQGKDLKKYPLSKLIQATKTDKKMSFGKVNYVLLKEIGLVHAPQYTYVHAISDDIIKQAFKKVIEG